MSIKKKTAVSLLLMVLLTPAANAKLYDTEKMTVSGPGLEGGLVISGQDWFLRRTRQPGTNHVMGGIFGDKGRIAAPRGDLGPAYRVTYHLAGILEETIAADVTQELYPFAEDGPVYHIPAQAISFGDVELRAKEGWAKAPPRVVAHLQSFGLPDAEPASGPDRRPILVLMTAAVLIAALLLRHRLAVTRLTGHRLPAEQSDALAGKSPKS